jgi:hypothetical protein
MAQKMNAPLKGARQIGANMTEVEHGDLTVLYSYETPVAFLSPRGGYVTDKRWSVTTSKHIAKFFDRHGYDRKGAFKVPQEDIEMFVATGKGPQDFPINLDPTPAEMQEVVGRLTRRQSKNPPRYVYTVQPHDVGRAILPLDGKQTVVTDFIGRVQSRDVGKRIYESSGVYQIENDEQVERRMRAKNPDSGSARLARSLRRRTLDAEHWPIKIVVRMKDPLDASGKIRTYSYFGWVTGDRKQVLNRKLRQARKEHPDAESIEVLADEEALQS